MHMYIYALVFHDSSYYISTTSRAAVLESTRGDEVVQKICSRNLYVYLFVLRSLVSYKKYTICVLYRNMSPPVPFGAAAQKITNFASSNSKPTRNRWNDQREGRTF